MAETKAYDRDRLRTRWQCRGIEWICPHKKNRVRPATQNGRALRALQKTVDRRTERRVAWKVPPLGRALPALAHNIYSAFFHIACFMIVLRKVVQ
jgi:hypothetical protein